MVKIDSLGKELPDGVRHIDAAGRKAQLAARADGVRRQFADS